MMIPCPLPYPAPFKIATYPLIKGGKLMSNIVLRCDDDARLGAATEAMREFLGSVGVGVIS